jgi:CHAT domain-containing protein
MKDKGKLALLKAQRSVVEAIQQSGKHVSGDVMQSGQSNQERSIYHGTMRTALSFWTSDSMVVVDQLNFLGECQRAQILQRSLQRADLVNQLEGEEQQWLKEDEALKNNLGDLNASLSRTENEEEVIALELQVNEVKRERTALQRTPPAGVRANFFQLYALPQVPSLRELQAAMSPEEALIQFVEMEQTLLVLTITKDAFYVEETPSFSVWERDLEDFKEALSEDESEQFVRSSRRIYDLCLAPAVTKLPARIKHLTMITDGPLRALNLEVCLRTDTVGGSYQKMDYLLRDYSVSYDYLLASYYDNLLEKTDQQLAELTVYAPSYVATSEQCQAPGEIEALNQLAHELVAERTDARLVDATKSKVRAASASSKNSFFAAHGIIDEENPMQSYLLLSSDEGEDCQLAIGEIMNWTFDGTDVVLGSCTTEAGKNIRGSGILSIAQAMTVAGARSLVANTDYIKDEPASILLRLYFDYRTQGLSKSESLRSAKLAYLDLPNEKISPPMYWANTILIGHKD